MRKYITKIIGIGFLLCFLLILYLHFFTNNFGTHRYGKSANSIREYVRIPVIESGMKRVKSVNKDEEGGKWEVENDGEKGTIHLWKIVSPNSGDYILYEELDMFRKYLNSENYWQLNMSSKILGDSISNRNGAIRFYQKGLVSEYQLGENELDSIFNDWGLDKLIKRNVSK